MVYDAERGEKVNTGLAGLLVGGERGVQEVCDWVMVQPYVSRKLRVRAGRRVRAEKGLVSERKVAM